MDFSKCWQDCAKDALKRIDHYREKINGDISDSFNDFYLNHLDLMQELLEEFQKADEKYVSLIVANERNQYEDGNSTPRYVTICKKPHWTHEGIMTTSGTHDATKFKPSSEELRKILRILNEDAEKYEIVLMDKRCLETNRHEYWEDKAVRGDWDETHSIGKKR